MKLVADQAHKVMSVKKVNVNAVVILNNGTVKNEQKS